MKDITNLAPIHEVQYLENKELTDKEITQQWVRSQWFNPQTKFGGDLEVQW